MIAIIAILAAILFPVFAKAREKARQTACLSNEKQIMLGVLMYAQDYDEMFPAVRFIVSATQVDFYPALIMPYIKNTQLFQCPSRSDVGIAGWGPGSFYPCGYGVSCLTFGVSMAAVKRPSEVISLGEIGGAPYGDGRINPCNSGGGSTCGAEYGAISPDFRHNEGMNFGFTDGHVKWLRAGVTWAGGHTGGDYSQFYKYWLTGD